MTVAAPPADRVTTYAEAVSSGEIVAGELVRRACARHLDDLAHGHERGLCWDQQEADRAIDFFSHLRQSKGRWADQPLSLLPWQQFVVGSVFGWKHAASGLRRFRRAYVEIARKGGKTTLAAGVGLYLLDFDGEPGAEVYAAATKRDQARLCWDEAARMVARTPALRKRIRDIPSRANLHVLDTASKFEALGADSDSTDGLNPHGVIVDELHAHRDRRLVDVLETAMGAREQPLMLYITTAGIAGESIYTETHQYARRVVEGAVGDDGWFVFIARPDADDDWRDESIYAKANPSLGVTVQLEELVQERDRAIAVPGRQNAFQRLRLNLQTSQETAWLDVAQWDACTAEQLVPDGPAVMGVDLGGNRDLTAAAIVHPDSDGGFDVRLHFWMPRDKVREASERDGVPYLAWIDEGWITATDGDYRDDARLLDELLALGAEHDVEEVCFDAWQMGYIATQLQDRGVTVVKIPQTFMELGPPCEALEAALGRGALRHLADPVLRWMVANVSVDEHPDGSRKPSKRGALKNRRHIDGVSALVTALARVLRRDGTPDIGSQIFL